ncbi:MAG: glutathione S-transferase N-terminal domain-containing protein [Pseudomonadota bacterium]
MMKLYSGTTCPFSQRCRIVFCEKGEDVQIINVDLFDKPQALLAMHPYDQVPVLIDRDLVLCESNIINEYIEERFPHPQLISGDHVVRARARLFLYRVEQELFSHIQPLEHGTAKQQESARRLITEHLTQITPVFSKQKYLLGNEFSMLDVAMAPLLWRLPHYQIAMPKQAGPLMEYAERVFSRPAFINSMTAAEKAMRK